MFTVHRGCLRLTSAQGRRAFHNDNRPNRVERQEKVVSGSLSGASLDQAEKDVDNFNANGKIATKKKKLILVKKKKVSPGVAMNTEISPVESKEQQQKQKGPVDKSMDPEEYLSQWQAQFPEPLLREHNDNTNSEQLRDHFLVSLMNTLGPALYTKFIVLFKSLLLRLRKLSTEINGVDNFADSFDTPRTNSTSIISQDKSTLAYKKRVRLRGEMNRIKLVFFRTVGRMLGNDAVSLVPLLSKYFNSLTVGMLEKVRERKEGNQIIPYVAAFLQEQEAVQDLGPDFLDDGGLNAQESNLLYRYIDMESDQTSQMLWSRLDKMDKEYYKIFVSHVPSFLTTRELMGAFSRCGKVIACEIYRGKCRENNAHTSNLLNTDKNSEISDIAIETAASYAISTELAHERAVEFLSHGNNNSKKNGIESLESGLESNNTATELSTNTTSANTTDNGQIGETSTSASGKNMARMLSMKEITGILRNPYQDQPKDSQNSYGFLYFKTEKGRNLALSQSLRIFGMSLNGHTIYPLDVKSRTNLVMTGLRRKMTHSDVQSCMYEILGKHKEYVEYIHVPTAQQQNKGFCIINFTSHEHAVEAHRVLNNALLYWPKMSPEAMDITENSLLQETKEKTVQPRLLRCHWDDKKTAQQKHIDILPFFPNTTKEYSTTDALPKQ